MAVSTAVDASAVARVLGIEAIFVNRLGNNAVLLPQRLAVIAQGATAATYSTTKAQFSSALDVAAEYGFGSPLHLISQKLFPANGDGVGTIPVTFYPLEDNASGVAADGDIIPAGSPTVAASYVIRVSGIDSAGFVISVGDSTADIVTAMTLAVNSNLDMPVIATDGVTSLTLDAKWAGTSSNKMFIELIGSTTAGNTFTITQMNGGLLNPLIDSALAQIGNVWETMILNAMEPSDSTALGTLDTFGEGRWGALTRKPLVAFTCDNQVSVNDATSIPDGRAADRTNVQLNVPGCNNLLFVSCARQVARIIKLANNNPAHDYGGRKADTLIPGADGDQWTYLEKDQAVKAGASTTDVVDGVVAISDVVTMYHPAGDPLPAYRYVVDIVKLQNVIFNLDLVFASAEWDGAPLIPDDQPTTNRAAKKPKTAKAAAAAVVDGLALEAILSDPETSKANILSEIDTANPKRLNLCVPVSLAGNTNIISIDLKFGFFFGSGTLVA